MGRVVPGVKVVAGALVAAPFVSSEAAAAAAEVAELALPVAAVTVLSTARKSTDLGAVPVKESDAPDALPDVP
jgi:hypothetical protein